MKTPQEIAAECWTGHDHDFVETITSIGITCRRCFDNTTTAIAAAREEGRRDGLEEAAQLAAEATHSHVCEGPNSCCAMDGAHGVLAQRIRALASQPKAEPAATCEGCRRGIPIRRTAHESPYHDSLGLLTPCTAAEPTRGGG